MNALYESIIDLCNSEAGRFLLGIDDAPVVALYKNSIHQHLGGNQYKATFQVGNYYLDKLAPILTKIDIAGTYKRIEDEYDAFLHYAGYYTKPQRYPQIYLTTYQENPTAGAGRCYTNLSGAWATVRALTASNNTDGAFTAGAIKSGTDHRIFRSFAPFDTSTLTAAAEISAATLDVHRNDSHTTFYNVDSTSIHVVTTTQASVSALITDDYDTASFTSKGSLAMASTSNSAYNSITISDTSIISKTSYTKLGALNSRDQSNTAPTGENTIGSSTDPRLTITYIASSIKKALGVEYASIKKINGVAIASVKKYNSVA